MFWVQLRRGMRLWWLTIILGLLLVWAGVWPTPIMGLVAGLPVCLVACSLQRRESVWRLFWVLVTATGVLLLPRVADLVGAFFSLVAR